MGGHGINYFTIPADFKKSTIEQCAQLNKQHRNSKIGETYGQITINNPIGSGRANDHLPQVDFQSLKDYVEFSHAHKIRFNYTLNTTCHSNREFSRSGMKEIVDFLRRLESIGIDSITVCLPSIMELIKRIGFDFKVKASTVCQITNAEKARSYQAMGIDQIVVDESVNRDFDTLKRIRRVYPGGTELIVNVVCYKNCIFEMFHHNQKSHDYACSEQNKSCTFYSHRCILKRYSEPENLLKLAWIRPEDIVFYEQLGIHNFKIQGRQAVGKGDILHTVRSYMDQSFDGNLMELLDCFAPTNSFQVYLDNRKLDGFLLPFVNHPGFCRNDCPDCQYCKTFLSNKIDWENTVKVMDKAKLFYRLYDQFGLECNQFSSSEEQGKE